MKIKLLKLLRLFLIFVSMLSLIVFACMRFRYQEYEASIQEVVSKGKNNQLKAEELFEKFGDPRFDEIQDRKIYNQGGDQDFNCMPPFRFLGFSGGAEILTAGKLEDNLYFYFDKDGNYCYFERSGL